MIMCVTNVFAVDRVAAMLPDDETMAKVTGLFKVLGDPLRARLLFALLAAGEMPVGDLVVVTGANESTVSQALRLLRLSGVVSSRRDGRSVIYRLADEHVRALLELSREHMTHDVAGSP
jgi:DNA-binding transcriptional ArsR family regulator